MKSQSPKILIQPNGLRKMFLIIMTEINCIKILSKYLIFLTKGINFIFKFFI